MAIQYIVREYTDHQNPDVEGKYYAKTVTRGLAGTRELAQRIAARSGHSVGAVQGVIEDILEAMVHFMKLGYNVDCGMAGRFQLKVRSEGQITAEEVDAGKIKKIYAHFQGRMSNYISLCTFQQVVNLNPKVSEEEPLP